jgi:hypothetical protein
VYDGSVTLDRKKILVDLIGYSALIPISVLYNYAEKVYGGYVAVLLACCALLPVAVAWHHYYAKVRRD